MAAPSRRYQELVHWMPMPKRHEIAAVDFEGNTLVLRADGSVFWVDVTKISDPEMARAVL